MLFKRSYLIVVILFLFLNTKVYPNDKINYIKDFFNDTEYQEVTEIILAQAILETGWLSSQKHAEYNNYWSVKDFKDPRCEEIPFTCIQRNNNIYQNCIMMLTYLRRKRYSTNKKGYYNDLVRKEYAEDPYYVKKLKSITRSLKRRGII